MVKPRTMPGVLELLPREQVAFQRMIDTIRDVYERFGFVPIETPAIELTEVLLTKTGGETERQVYFVESTGQLSREGVPELALPFDLTVPFARYVAEHENDLVFPFRRYQIQRVYRGESPQRGRFREFYQCDVDVVDRDDLSLRYDGEMPAIIHEVFTRLDIGPFTVRLNNRKIMRGLLSQMGVVGEDHQAAVLREVDKLDRQGRDAVASSLGRLGVETETVDRLLDLTATRSGTHAEAVEILDRIAGDDPALERGIDEMRQVLETVRSLGVPEARYCVDLSIARGLDYYTGTVYETTLDHHQSVGSICSGGRYDDLAGHYTDSRLPGVGVSIGLTRLFWQLRELGMIDQGAGLVEAYVTLMDEDLLPETLALASMLRQAGINTEAAMQPGRLGKQLRYADRAGIRFALILGEDERARGTVAVKDLAGETQREVPRSEVAAHLLASR